VADIEIRPETLRRAADDLDRAAAQFRSQLEQMRGQLSGFADAWGNDDLGALIGETVTVCTDVLDGLFTDILDELDHDAADLVGIADNHEHTDSQAATRFKQTGV